MDERRKATTRRDTVGNVQMAPQNRAECNWGVGHLAANLSIGRIRPKEESQMPTGIIALAPARRAPAWSGWFTAPLARITPDSARPAVLAAIKGIHTAIFVGVTVQIAIVVWDGLRQRPGRGTVTALAIAIAESAIYASNNQVCPLTPLAEELGAENGSVTDIFLPNSVSSRIPLVGGSALILGLALNLWAWIRR